MTNASSAPRTLLTIVSILFLENPGFLVESPSETKAVIVVVATIRVSDLTKAIGRRASGVVLPWAACTVSPSFAVAEIRRATSNSCVGVSGLAIPSIFSLQDAASEDAQWYSGFLGWRRCEKQLYPAEEQCLVNNFMLLSLSAIVSASDRDITRLSLGLKMRYPSIDRAEQKHLERRSR